MPDHVLTFELNEGNDQLLIHGDEQGLRFLIESLESLLAHTKEGQFNHEHLKMPTWGGDELSEESQAATVLHHVEIYCWKVKGDTTLAA
jgi:Immunity protein 32